MKTKLFTRAASALVAGTMVLTMSAASAFASIPTAYSPNANITVDKTLTAAQAGIWPDTTAFTFNLEAVGYTAGPASLTAPYTAYTTANMPMPAVGTANTAPSGDPQSETVTVSPFTKPSTLTTETVNAKTGDVTYTQAGVYTYKVTEIVPTPQVPGITYDASVYFINVYVTNVLNDDSTPYINTDTGIPYVNVSNITVYKGTNTTTDPTVADTGGTNKTSITTPATTDATARNIATAFTNAYTTTDLTVTKKVTGTMADVNKEFDFTLALTNSLGTDTRSYAYQVWSMGADRAKGGTDDTKVTTTGKSGTLTNGDTFTLKHDEYIVITGLPTSEIVNVTENGAEDYETSISTRNDNSGATQPSRVGKSVGDMTISTDTGAINEQDFVNNKEAVSPTGIALESVPFILIVSAAGVALFFVIRKRKDAAR